MSRFLSTCKSLSWRLRVSYILSLLEESADSHDWGRPEREGECKVDSRLRWDKRETSDLASCPSRSPSDIERLPMRV